METFLAKRKCGKTFCLVDMNDIPRDEKLHGLASFAIPSIYIFPKKNFLIGIFLHLLDH